MRTQTSVKATLLWALILTLLTSGAANSAEQNDVGATRPDPKGQRTEVRVGIYAFDVTGIDEIDGNSSRGNGYSLCYLVKGYKRRERTSKWRLYSTGS